MDMKTRIAQLLADTLRKAWPQAGELPQAEELRPLLNAEVAPYISKLSTRKIHKIINGFGEAAVLAVKAGFDMVQVHGDRMCGSFSSTVFNHRTEEYGGSAENRARFAVEAVKAIRSRLPEIPIDYKLAVRQEDPHYGNAGVVDGTWARVDISTLSGAIELAGEAENAEIETASGKVDIAGALGALDFESVSGNLILATERALRLDAETESGSIYLTLPAQDGFTLDYETKSGAFRSALTEREGALITCLDDHATHYSVPALDGGAVSELTIETMSGEVTIGASSSGSN